MKYKCSECKKLLEEKDAITIEEEKIICVECNSRAENRCCDCKYPKWNYYGTMQCWHGTCGIKDYFISCTDGRDGRYCKEFEGKPLEPEDKTLMCPKCKTKMRGIDIKEPLLSSTGYAYLKCFKCGHKETKKYSTKFF